MKIAYADPPYIGQASKHYGCPEVDHRALIDKLVCKFPDGWALSASSPSLLPILFLCPTDVRVGAWVKPFASFKPGVNPAYAWEPVIFRGGRQKRKRTESTVRDWVSANITLKKGLAGAKPKAFSFWLFELMGMGKGDDFVDLSLEPERYQRHGRNGPHKRDSLYRYMAHKHKYSRFGFCLVGLVWIWKCRCGRWFAKR